MASAQTVIPNAGQVLRDIPQAPLVPTPQTDPSQQVDAAIDSRSSKTARFAVKAIVLSGNKEVPTAPLQTLVEGAKGPAVSLEQLDAAARRITAYYRRKGYAVARAYLPEQDITAGTVTIAIVEGHIAGHVLNNRSSLSNERVSKYLGDIQDGDVVRSTRIERGLLLLQDTPGISASHATLQPGASPGTSELLIDVLPAAAIGGDVSLDNYGGRYVGEYRLSSDVSLANPLKIGDQLSATGLTSGKNLQYGRLAYQVPVGADGLRVGVAYFDLHYKLGKEFAALDAHGTARSATLYAGYPLIRSAAGNLSATTSLEDKHLDDDVGATSTASRKNIQVVGFALSGLWQDGFSGGGVNRFNLAWTLGHLGIQPASTRAIDAASAQTQGEYSKLSYALSRQQRLASETWLLASLTGQLSSKNLDSSEKFSLGGPTGVRAYPTDEATGDSGYTATLELRQLLRPGIQGALFYDMGSIETNKHPFDAKASNRRTLSGAGLGVNITMGKLEVRTSLAWRVSGGAPKSIPASAAKTPALEVLASLAL
ncbi:ShlB/FhaC/HecB family hemolysin secretion/activation protein [Dyella subtropica]|uniref:ShlB/FhaC/HecB family hemolysin secretion/activation protein n=1 Tax=Dyella subtropica TaxID=2992127 RepID=UPI002258FE23|nr:ShlB/FhaC/HecB family hemolysin secretion/activation protein [Dyella subtropica]